MSPLGLDQPHDNKGKIDERELSAAQALQLGSDLTSVVDAWPELSIEIRSEILRLVKLGLS